MKAKKHSYLVLWSPWVTNLLPAEAARSPSQRAGGWGPADMKPRHHFLPRTGNAPAAHCAPTLEMISGRERSGRERDREREREEELNERGRK